MNIGYAVKSGGDEEVYGALGVDNPRYTEWKAGFEAEGYIIVKQNQTGAPWGVPSALKYIDPDVLEKTEEERFRIPLTETATNLANYLREQEYEADIVHTLENIAETSGHDSGIFRTSGSSKFDLLGSLSASAMFPQTWKCEDGGRIVTLVDMQGLIVAIAQRRQTSVYNYRDIKDGFAALTIQQLRDWIETNQP